MLEKLPKKPEYFAGIKVDGAYERFLRKEEEKARAKVKINPEITQTNINNFIYVPSTNCYLAKQRTHLGADWYNTHKTLHQENLLMPTILQFIASINYLKQNPNETQDASQSEIARILDDILTVRDPWRAEWLDAKFENKDKKLYINYNHRTDLNGNLVPQNSEPLEECLMEDKLPGINLDSLLINHTSQGLPKPNVSNGSLYYYHPRENCVARFRAGSGRADLYCGSGPGVSDASLGVFSVCEANAAQRKI